MSRFRILKELKKTLKRKRRHVWSLGAGAAIFLLAALAGSWLAQRVIANQLQQVEAVAIPAGSEADKPALESDMSSRGLALKELSKRDGEVEMILHRTYLCGEETRKLGKLAASEAADLLKAHREWEASFDRNSGKLTMVEAVDDLSPACRDSAYMGIDKDGNLSLFDGPPWQEKVVRTFFQLDVDMLESRLSEDRVKELSDGIRIADKDEYNSVLSSLNEYASIRTQVAPQP
ncbi:hypothetical protein D7Z26_12895 [Cohnella endophytica]|uniref:Bypass of forespore C C-terminal domain-containing protein n=1 Tax=Cohnella endophytica TaxID=2419778 RepID=A0A494XUL5_9BACL|nr:BofC C-terminal domain-containing protein [Cohnella endophytica]RKP54260.1 hypothetical protein D7Z26_12895 [Cohnella endophytica]